MMSGLKKSLRGERLCIVRREAVREEFKLTLNS